MKAQIPENSGYLLVVDDDPNICKLAAQRLADLGLAVRTAGSVAEAEAAVRARAPELMLLDYRLPGPTSLELLDRLKESGAETPPFIMMTGCGGEAVAVAAMKAGASDYLIKDGGLLDRLAPAVRSALERGRLLRELEASRASTVKNFRLYNILAQVSLAAARAKSREELYRGVCEIAVGAGGLRMAWIGLPDPAGERLRPAHWAGHEDGYLSDIGIKLSGKDPAGRGPSGSAAATNSVRTCPDIESDPLMAPWRERALSRGYRSSAALPLTAGGRLAAVLSLYSAEKRFFDSQEVRLLGEIQANLSLALDSLSVSEALESQRRLFSDVLDNSEALIYALDLQGRFLIANKATGRLLGSAPGDMIGRTRAGLVPEDHRARHEENDRQVIKAGREVFFEEATEGPRGRQWFYSAKFPLRDAAGKIYGVCGISTDITARKRAEEAAALNEARLESLARIVAYKPASEQDLLDYALSEAMKLTGSGFGYIYHYDEARQEFELNTWSKGVMEACKVVNPQTRYELAKTGLWGEAVRQRRPIIVNDFSAPNPHKKGYPEGHAALSSFMTIPVIVREKIVSVVGVANKTGPYTESDQRQLTLLMDSVWKIVEARRSADSALEKEKRYRDLFDNMLDAVALHELVDGPDGRPADYRFLSVNPSFERILGMQASAVVGRTVKELIPGLGDFWVNTYARVVETGRPADFCRREPQLGKSFHVVAVPAGGRRFATFFQDVTERERALEELAASERRFQALIDASPYGVVVRRGETVVYINRSGLDIMRAKDEADITGHSILERMSEKYRPLALSRIEAVDKLDRSTPPVEMEYLALDGTPLQLEVNSHPIVFGGEKCAVIFFKDIADRKRAERLLQEVASAQRIESLGQLAGGIAHDFNNMLTGIMANISLLERRLPGDGDDAELVKETLEATRAAQSLTANLLTFSRGGKPVKKEFQLRDALSGIFRLATRGSGCACELDLPEELWSVEGDENQLKQAVNNLLLNSQQAMPSGGKLRLSAANAPEGEPPPAGLPPGRYITVTVSDTGVGIPKEYLGHIFDPYFTTKTRGHGLGLSMTWSVVKNHGGHIVVSSEPGRGSVFEVWLPATGRAFKTAGAAAAGVRRGRGRVLALEDEKIVASALARMLRELGYACEVVRDGLEAVRRYDEELRAGRPFDAVIMDLTIPGGVGGAEAVILLRKSAPAAKVIVSSGYSDEGDMADYKDRGFDAALPKPYRFEELSSVLAGLLGAENGKDAGN